MKTKKAKKKLILGFVDDREIKHKKKKEPTQLWNYQRNGRTNAKGPTEKHSVNSHEKWKDTKTKEKKKWSLCVFVLIEFMETMMHSFKHYSLPSRLLFACFLFFCNFILKDLLFAIFNHFVRLIVL